MSFLIDAYEGWSGEEAEQRFKVYAEYLEKVKSALPKSAFSFVTAHWHYQFLDRHCPHDGWVEHLTIWESASGDRQEQREIQIEMRLLGSFHKEYLELNYKDVRSYELRAQPHANQQASRNVGHGDWLIDEVRLSENHLVLHEILFRDRGRWLIEASDILWEWKPLK
jgi:hypothetical protein